MSDDIAAASVSIAAPVEAVWRALTDPATIAKYYFGAKVTTDWEPGSTITWAGKFHGSSYEDYGEILHVDPPRMLRHTHFSPLSGKPDIPANYHTVTYTLTSVEGITTVALEQDNNESSDAAAHAASNWQTMLDGLKSVVEQNGAAAAESS